MNKLQQEIMEIIEPYMDKTLSEGCYIKDADYETWLHKIVWELNNNFITLMYKDLWKPHIERKTDVEDWEILWHYDITAVLKYMWDKKKIKIWNWLEQLVCESDKFFEWYLPNKPLILYTEQENISLLKLLWKIVKQ